MNRALSGLIAFGSLVLPATAQQEVIGYGMSGYIGDRPTIASAWQTFVTDCSAVMSDPEAFVSGHPQTGIDGLPLITRSPDGQVVHLYDYDQNNLDRYVMLIGVPGVLRIDCQVDAGWNPPSDPAAAEAEIAQEEAAFRAVFEAIGDDAVVVGGAVATLEPYLERATGLPTPITRHFGVLAEIADRRVFVHAFLRPHGITFHGHYAFTESGVVSVHADGLQRSGPVQEDEGNAASDAAATQSAAEEAAANMRLAATLCLRHVRTPSEMVAAFEAAGFSTRPWLDAGTFEVEAPGVYAILSDGQGTPEGACNVQSNLVPLGTARAIGDAIVAEYPAGAFEPGWPGEPQSAPDPDCVGYTAWGARPIITMAYAAAGNSGECLDSGSSIVID